MTTATHALNAPAQAAPNRPNMVSVGTVVWLASELMFFAALFAMYFTLRAASPEMWATETVKLNVPFALVNTIILVSSSFTCQLGVFRAEDLKPRRTGGLFNLKEWGMVEWFVLTVILGSIFVSVQAYEYTELVAHGIALNSNAYGSVFYMTTGFHGLHVAGGLVAFMLIIGRALVARKFGHYEATGAIVVSYYWHFVDVVWIALFAIIYFLK
ncbi:heme-copper oxidase subunit III [Paeniglutamicibacter gangotriensis]|uniref:cytochrome-c oxidase n=1 Tax=Paeniglutamicibacter gangotriensis TaxID=254787 RepID=A0A5B0EC18_9MICC|nr:heme-copper oxidase subunit III [Paeniglutamicibacter gangotriensis]KAA0976587.1 heme-copper oxidase subunit III [Paeniglutamicibacter gangotriensis]